MAGTWDDKTLNTDWNLTLKSSGKPIILGQKDMKSAFGGEGLIYLQNNKIYKVYPDTKKLPPEKKLLELSALKHPSIVVPQDLLLDSFGKLKGFTMPYHDAYELCQLFPKAFKDRHKITPAQITNLAKIMQDGNKYLHSRGCLMVDGNEMNYLVSKNFDNVFFIDSNSYQTPSFPATAIMESVRDFHTKGFNKNSDWYSWAIVTFQMFIGVHPYKGNYKKNLPMTERMKQNISVFNPDVAIPKVCAPFDIIPSALRDWYEAVFERGMRSAPPDSYESKIFVGHRVTKQIGSDNFVITLLYTYQKDVIAYSGGFTMTKNGIYKDDKAMVALEDVCHIVQTPQGQGVLARLSGGKVKLFSIMSKTDIPTNFNADDMMSYQGRLYLRNRGDVNEVSFVELGNKVIATLKKVGNVIENDTHMFDGCAISNLSNVCHVSIFPKAETCYQLQIPELANHKILDAKFDNGVLMVVALGANNDHDKFIFRFEAGFKSYDVRIQQSIQVSEINFIVLDKGVVLHMTDAGVLECFRAIPGAKDIMEIHDQAIDTDCTLLKQGDLAMFARGEKLYKFSMQTKQAGDTNVPTAVRNKYTGKLEVKQLTTALKQKDKVFKDIYDKDDVLISTITGGKVNPTSGMI